MAERCCRLFSRSDVTKLTPKNSLMQLTLCSPDPETVSHNTLYSIFFYARTVLVHITKQYRISENILRKLQSSELFEEGMHFSKAE